MECRRCNSALKEQRDKIKTNNFSAPRILTRITLLTAFFLVAWYASLVTTSQPLKAEQQQMVDRAIVVLQQQGFATEVSLLKNVTTFRATDHWWNRQWKAPQAYAATNFPFEVLTLYSEFFTRTADDTERAVILLHESYHLRGYGEVKAHEEVWKLKERLGYTSEVYGRTRVWTNMRDDTMTYAPQLFTCGTTGREDCTARTVASARDSGANPAAK